MSVWYASYKGGMIQRPLELSAFWKQGLGFMSLGFSLQVDQQESFSSVLTSRMHFSLFPFS